MASPKSVVLHVVLVTSLWTICAGVQFKVRGMAFSSGHDLWGYRQPFADESLRKLKATGTTHVHLTVIVGMENIYSFTSYAVTDDDSVRYIIRKCKRFGFKVFLKPIVQTKGFVWRGFIPGTDKFFRTVYKPYIVRMAKIAQQEGVAIFSVGSELQKTEHMVLKWRSIIKSVRKVYRGKVTYVANHDSFSRVRFWKYLDIISLSGYFRLLKGHRGYSPDMKTTKELWMRKARRVAKWRERSGHTNMQILIAEGGSMSKGNGVVYRTPWDYDVKAATSLWDQAKMYEGLLNAFMAPDWSMGVFIYNWELRPFIGNSWPMVQGYTPQGKPALHIMKKYWRRKY